MLVVDSSIVLSWLLGDEASAITDALADDVHRTGAIGPAHLRAEVANVLVMLERRRRISSAAVIASLSDFEDMAIQFEPGLDAATTRAVVQLARAEGLTVYDASYLELALRLDAELFTLDKDLVAAARRHGVPVRP
ncbi:type II toxin-antitoxin system VapC family toxin [Caulobacter sp. NIBR1757]|uniref:type II toxin-antitoxin system VapC family toxin n=1 Tax=Caulobacter sp. NIBR1757 TaxID=3016000 RepID=UPI0022F144A1|nr:type II toxin-antitoxin system VapC family toxin [Caulobacter sp. NIBR1757]